MSFEDIFRTEAARVGRTLRYLGVREAHVEDACQEVFVVVHRRLAEFDGQSASAWLRQICIHVANNHRRAVRRRPEDSFAEPPEVAMPPRQYGDAEQTEARRRLVTLLDELPDEQRTVFVLFEIEQLSMQETAKAVGCALQTAYSRLYAARKKIQLLIEGAKT